MMQRLVTSRYSFLQRLCGTTGVTCVDTCWKRRWTCMQTDDTETNPKAAN